MFLWLILIIPPMLLAFWAQSNIRSTYNKYAQVASSRGITGQQLAESLLKQNGLYNMPVHADTRETLENYFDPRDKSLHLSPEIARSSSLAALGIVAHEVGHAVQDAQQYGPMKLRSLLVPAAQLGSNIAPLIIFAGFIINFTGLVWLGIAFFAAATLFSIATLPVELDASRRANVMLANTGVLVTTDEQQGARKVLGAAAWTYVAAVIASLAQLIYWVTVARR